MSAPTWLADFQARFGATLQSPLDRSTGTLTARSANYDSALVAETSGSRLEVYNRQYWFRLFDVLQNAFPLTSRLMGYWSFNEIAARYFTAHPPKSWDIERAADAFADFFADPVWSDCVRIDAAYRDVFRAPATTAFRPTADDAPHLMTGQLVPSPAIRIVTEQRALVAHRMELAKLPPLLPAPQSWAIVRVDEATRAIALEPREAELLRLLARHPLGAALATLERACTDDERATLPDRVRGWLARSIELGFWCALRRAQLQTTQL